MVVTIAANCILSLKPSVHPLLGALHSLTHLSSQAHKAGTVSLPILTC